ncbi:hypothetical protein [Bradyrhizobium sp. SZCCHNRI20481]|uniref:hypothetical protein n=1 Tax=Bradyrhizobium sp. SZCCHNRI20481 TaxID=3057286 RepID=UPI0029167904|nr:hypothetical protein [Bradyrhizobium sp. SZCCHNRI20481]
MPKMFTVSRWQANSVVGTTCLLLCTHAYAIEPKDVTFYCTSEAVGGLRYDEQLKKWRSANFQADGRFVLKLEFVSTTSEPIYEGASPSIVHRFRITVRPAGSTIDSRCIADSDDGLVAVWPRGHVRCSYSLSELRFNPANNRFLESYLIGYISGEDNNKDTPSIAAGICTKID